jgi:hypothetical protein
MNGSSYSMGGPPQTERVLGLPVAVILLRRDGARITGAEFKAAVQLVGRLLLGPTSRHQSGGGATHMADLIKPGALELGSVCKPLFNPVIELTDQRGFILRGYEIQATVSVGSEVAQVEHLEQVWLVRPLTAADAFDSLPATKI